MSSSQLGMVKCCPSIFKKQLFDLFGTLGHNEVRKSVCKCMYNPKMKQQIPDLSNVPIHSFFLYLRVYVDEYHKCKFTSFK